MSFNINKMPQVTIKKTPNTQFSLKWIFKVKQKMEAVLQTKRGVKLLECINTTFTCRCLLKCVGPVCRHAHPHLDTVHLTAAETYTNTHT